MLDNQTLQDKYPHLEVSVLKLSEVKKDNESFRIDSEYFKKEYLTKKAKLLPISTKLKNLMTSGYYGILPKSDDYLDEGLNLIRGKDVRDSSIEISNLIKVPHSYFQERYCVHKNDILFLVKGATIGYSDGVLLIIDEPSEKMIFNGSVFKLQVKNINPFYLYAFMMTHYFTFQKLREVANNGIEYNSLPTIKNFLIPIFPMPFQLEIENLVKDSHKALESSKALYKEAEALLYEALGLDSKNPLQSILNTHANRSYVIARNEMTKQSIYRNIDCHKFDKLNSCNDEAVSSNYTIATLKESFLKTGRLDAEYYQSKYEDIERFIKNYKGGYGIVSDFFTQNKNICDFSKPYYNYIEIGDINTSNGNINYNKIATNELPANAKIMVRKGDILISKVRPYRGAIGIVNVEKDNLIASGAFVVLQEKGSIKKEFLQVLLRTSVYKEWVLRYNVGTSYPVIKDEDILNLPIPLFDSTTQTQIAAHIQKSFELRAEAKNLLESAKAEVESALNDTATSGGGVNHTLISLQILRIYLPQIKAKLKKSKRFYRLAQWLLIETLCFRDTLDSISCHKANVFYSTTSPNYTIRTLANSLKESGRLDAEYYQNKYEKNEALLKSLPHKRLHELVDIYKSIEPGSNFYKEKGLPFVRVSNLSKFGVGKSEVYLDSKDFAKESLQSLYPKKDDVLLSKDGSVGIAYAVENDLECVLSGAILRLKIKDKAEIKAKYLSLVLNALTTQLQAQRDCGGSIIAHWRLEEIQNLLIPLLDFKTQEKIEAKIEQSFFLRAKSKKLLRIAKQRVEEAIVSKKI